MVNLSVLKGYEGLIFDLDGTLVNSMQFHIRAWQEVGEKRGVSIPTDYLAANGGRPSILIAGELAEKYGFRDSFETLQREKTANYVRHIPELYVYPDMKALMEYAAYNSIPMIIGTGTLRSNVEAVMKYTGIDKYITAFICSDQVRRHKPAPDTFILAAETIGKNPADCLVFEDAPLGIESARRGGMDCCVVKDGHFDLGEIIHPDSGR
jgi:HAD superfamily hydrolase (TIGR01509 family)